MKKLFNFLALSLLAGTAAAQGVSIYGTLDTGIEYVTNVGASGGHLTRMPQITGSVPSRLGFRGVESLGGGLSAIFVLESGFGVDSGVFNQGGRTFGRQSSVALKGPWGTAGLGRQYSLLVQALPEADILGPNIYGSGSLDAYLPNARADNSLAYTFDFKGFSGGVEYSLGRDVAGGCPGELATSRRACRQWSAALRFDNPGWGVAAATDKQYGGPGAAAGLSYDALADTRLALSGYVRTGALKFGAGVIRRKNDGAPLLPKSDLAWLGVNYLIGESWILDAQYFVLDYKNSNTGAKLLALRITHPLSKRTALYGTFGRIDNDGVSALSVSAGAPGSAPAAGQAQNGVMLGMRHSF